MNTSNWDCIAKFRNFHTQYLCDGFKIFAMALKSTFRTDNLQGHKPIVMHYHQGGTALLGIIVSVARVVNKVLASTSSWLEGCSTLAIKS